MVLKLKALKTIGMPTSENPDTYVGQKSDDEIFGDIEIWRKKRLSLQSGKE